MTKQDQTVTIRAKAFSGEGVREHKCTVASDGTVRVWDSVAGHYTACHSLSESAVRRVRKLAGVYPPDSTYAGMTHADVLADRDAFNRACGL